uniref:Uncharacterized protein LOC116955410 n=1 Tax=Petromyzon marinus TaxID=7757 RepID=A0AAJ7UBU0_PETMA|nr:uncharacterized protein LOC116955410 [Petromyzon marinus]
MHTPLPSIHHIAPASTTSPQQLRQQQHHHQPPPLATEPSTGHLSSGGGRVWASFMVSAIRPKWRPEHAPWWRPRGAVRSAPAWLPSLLLLLLSGPVGAPGGAAAFQLHDTMGALREENAALKARVENLTQVVLALRTEWWRGARNTGHAAGSNALAACQDHGRHHQAGLHNSPGSAGPRLASPCHRLGGFLSLLCWLLLACL